ncbi:30S ribosomal protein S7 [Candidatus Peribacteria bacterium]|nr:30S ribosomal protein S7 [Candidatus Peribacteria bacterium]
MKYSNPFSYSDPLQSKMVNCLMHDGKKSIAQRILTDTFDELHRRGHEDPKQSFEIALQNATPNMEVKPKRIGGGVYQIPMEVTPKRQQTLSIRWILDGARKRKGIPMYKRLALELHDASNDTGYAVQKKEEVHRVAQANRAFAHLARY